MWHRDGVAWRNLYRLSDGDGKILKVESEVGKARGEGGGQGGQGEERSKTVNCMGAVVNPIKMSVKYDTSFLICFQTGLCTATSATDCTPSCYHGKLL